MKKIVLSLALLSSGCLYADDAVRADAFLNDYVAQGNPILVDEAIGEEVFAALQNKEVIEELVRVCKLSLKADKVKRLHELLDIMVQLELLAQDPDFAKQWKRFVELSQNLKEEDIEQAAQKLEKECPLIVEQTVLSEKLRGFYAGFGKGMQKLNLAEILEDIKQDLE